MNKFSAIFENRRKLPEQIPETSGENETKKERSAGPAALPALFRIWFFSVCALLQRNNDAGLRALGQIRRVQRDAEDERDVILLADGLQRFEGLLHILSFQAGQFQEAV